MSVGSSKKKFQFWIIWTSLNTLTFIIALAVAYLIMLTYFTNPGYAMGTHFEESRNTILFQSIAGIIIGFVQWLLLRKRFKVAWLWIFVVPIVIIIADAIVFVILGMLDIHWGEYSDNYPISYPILIIAEFILIGLVQSILLAKHSANVYSWILASSAPCLIILLATLISPDPIVSLISLILGLLLYCALTGAVLMWAVITKESKR